MDNIHHQSKADQSTKALIPEKVDLRQKGDLPAAHLTLPSEHRVREESEKGAVVAIHAGKSYSLETAAARVRLRWDADTQEAQVEVEYVQQSEFTAGSGAVQRALRQAETLAARRRIRRIGCELSQSELAQMSQQDHQDLLTELQDAGYQVEYTLQARTPGKKS